MATTVQLERVIGKALMNPQFRQELLADPTAAARSMRIRLEPEQIERIRGIDREALDKLIKELSAVIPPPPGHSFTLW